MDWSLVIFILVVVYFAYRGFRNGLLKSISRVLSILAGYVCAFLYTGDLSRLIESMFQLRGIVAFIFAAMLLFIGAGILVSLLFGIIGKFAGGGDRASTASAFGGAAVGALVGILLAIAAVWIFAFVRDLNPAFSIETSLPVKPSRIEKLVNKAASSAVDTAMSLGPAPPVVVRLSAAMVETPAATAQHAKDLLQSDDFVALLSDPQNQRVLNSGEVAAVRQLPDFQRLAANPDLLALATSAGLLETTGDNGQSMEDELAAQVTDIWLRTQNVKNDPHVQEILHDADFQQTINSGNPLALIADSRFLELADIIFSERAAPGGSPPAADDVSVKPKKPTKVYSWTDSSGRVHYSDVEPGS